MATERVEHRAQRLAIHLELFELALEHSATRVLAALRDRDEPKEHLSGDVGGTVPKAGQEALGTLDQRAGHSAERLVRGEVDPTSASAIEQLGERVLQQWQRAGPIRHLPEELGDQRRFERHAVRFSRDA